MTTRPPSSTAFARWRVDPAARGLLDDAAVLEVGGDRSSSPTTCSSRASTILPSDPPGDVAWKLVAVNLSDLAAKGARPVGVLLGYTLGDDGLGPRVRGRARQRRSPPSTSPCSAATRWRRPDGAPRSLGLTAIGRADGAGARRAAARGRAIFSGSAARSATPARASDRSAARSPRSDALVERYRNPTPAARGRRSALAPLVTRDDGRVRRPADRCRPMAAASGCSVAIDLDAVPLSEALAGTARRRPRGPARRGDRRRRLRVAVRGAPCAGTRHPRACPRRSALPLSRIGGSGRHGVALAMPARPSLCPTGSGSSTAARLISGRASRADARDG